MAADCPSCDKIAAQQGQQTVLKQTRLVYVKKNQDYMQQHASAEMSTRVKVQSNIVQARIQLETIDNNLIFLKQDFDKKGCVTCATIKEN